MEIEDLGDGRVRARAHELLGGGTVKVVGTASYQGVLDEICGGRTEDGHHREARGMLLTDTSNEYDELAVAVYVDGEQVGYLSRQDARRYYPVIGKLYEYECLGVCRATIRGGWDRGGGDAGHYGVELDLASPEALLDEIAETDRKAGVRPTGADSSSSSRRALIWIGLSIVAAFVLIGLCGLIR